MAELYLGKIPIVRRSLNEGFIRGLPEPEFRQADTVARDFSEDPVSVSASPDELELVEESDYDAIYEERQKSGSGLGNKMIRALEAKEYTFVDQDRFPDCWYHSMVNGASASRLLQNLEFILFNAVAGATILNRTNGGWCGLSTKDAMDNGIPVAGKGSGEWPYQSRSGKNDAAFKENRARHKIIESYYDLGREVYDQKLSNRQLSTCCFQDNPNPADFMRHGHSMLIVDKVRIEKGSWAWLVLNSWKAFGYLGLCVMPEMPDNAVSIRVVRPSSPANQHALAV